MGAKEVISEHTIEINPLVEADIEQLVPILKQHVRSRLTGELEEGEIADIQNYMRGGKDEDEGRVRKYLVAKDETGKVWGCMAYSTPDKDMVAYFGVNDDKSVELLNAFVDKDVFRGGGVGRKLFEAICAAAKSEEKKELLINSGPRYRHSWGFYTHLCGENTGMIVEKYGKGGDAMTWRKTL